MTRNGTAIGRCMLIIAIMLVTMATCAACMWIAEEKKKYTEGVTIKVLPKYAGGGQFTRSTHL
jgi:hypothetical protein